MKSFCGRIVYFLVALACVICVLVAVGIGDELNSPSANVNGR